MTELLAHLRAHRWPPSFDEYGLQDAVEAILNDLSLPYVREAILTDRDRPDFHLDDGLVIECKVASSPSDVARQLDRYLAHRRVTGAILITSRAKHLSVITRLNSLKPMHVILTGAVL